MRLITAVILLILTIHDLIQCKLPSRRPTRSPTGTPTGRPTSFPTVTFRPTPNPTSFPTRFPSSQPTNRPTASPSCLPTPSPSAKPTYKPTSPTPRPSARPSRNPIIFPSTMPTVEPTKRPSSRPTTSKPTFSPKPTIPTDQPTRKPSSSPTTPFPSQSPSALPSRPTSVPTNSPSSFKPTYYPSSTRTSKPTILSYSPSKNPTIRPSKQPTIDPTYQPTKIPSSRPSRRPTPGPTYLPTFTRYPTSQPTVLPSSSPTAEPSVRPTSGPSVSKPPTSHPTSRPSSYPSQPSTQPSSQPSRQPSYQPSAGPTCQPTSTPSAQPSTYITKKPSRIPTALPTRNPSAPSSRPTGKPSSRPTSRPTSFPTSYPTQSFRPTSYPTSRPSSRPSLIPTTSWGSSYAPTPAYLGYNTTGTVSFDPDEEKLCHDTEIDISILINRNVSYGTKLYITTPGITSGSCTSPVNGRNISTLDIYNTTTFHVKYIEGNYLINFIDSYLIVTVLTDNFLYDKTYNILIDRSNELKRSCLFNSSWKVEVKKNGYHISTGTLSVQESYPKLCFFYYSYLYFNNPYQQYPIGINFTFKPSFHYDNNTFFLIHLPYFTNEVSNYPLDNLHYNYSSVDDVLYYSQNSTLSSIITNANYSWTGRWINGNSTTIPYNSTYLILYPQGSQYYMVDIWVYIDRRANHIIPLCGSPVNYTGFQYQTLSISSLYYTNLTSFDLVTGVGVGCSLLNNCNKNGICDYCYSRCKCYDGFGSENDKVYAVTDDFKRDCTSRTCPLAPARGISRVAYTDDMHRLIECANNGICDRSSGKCQCFDGYYGSACDRRGCPGTPACNGRGQCLSMSVIAYHTNTFPLQNSSTYYTRKRVNGSIYKAWDSYYNHQCVCDSSWTVGLGSNETQLSEYFGVSCEYRRCPSGDDPMTTADETDCYGVSQVSGGGNGESGNLCHIDCSNRGLCDYSTGLCKCFPGFMGVNCGLIEKYPGLLTTSRIYWPTRSSTNVTIVKF